MSRRCPVPPSALSAESAAYVNTRLVQVGGIVAIAARAYAPDYTASERPDASDMITSIGFAARLMHECLNHLDEAPGCERATCSTDSWLKDLFDGVAMFDMLETVCLSDGHVVEVADDAMTAYLDALASLASRAAIGLREGQIVRMQGQEAHDATRIGADALQSLLRQLHEVSNASFTEDIDEDIDAGDPRDYRLLAQMVQASVADNLQHQDPEHREGYLRALTDLLGMVADGGVPCEDWDPIDNTAAAFAAPAPATH